MKYRYSFLITPLKLFIDCISIFLVVFFISDPNYYNTTFIVYILSFWNLSSIITKYYQVYRFTKFFRLLSLSVKHYFIFILGFVFITLGLSLEYHLTPSSSITKFELLILGFVFTTLVLLVLLATTRLCILL